MSGINVLVAATTPDVKAEVIAASVAVHRDMHLIERRCVPVVEVDGLLQSIASASGCALVLVGHANETDELAQRWLKQRDDLVVMVVDIVGDVVRIGLRDPGLDSLLATLCELVNRFGRECRERVAHVQLSASNLPDAACAMSVQFDTAEPPDAVCTEPLPCDVSEPPIEGPPTEEPVEIDGATYPRPLMQVVLAWVHALLRCAVTGVSEENGDVHGFSVTRATLLQALEAPPSCADECMLRELWEAEQSLDMALADSKNGEPLAVAARVFGLGPHEFRLLALALAPELDLRFQRCLGFLLDEMGRRVGTLSLFQSLLGITALERDQLNGDVFARWLIFEGYAGRPAAADEPLRLDPFLAQWLLGERRALAHDPRVRRVLRHVPWPGTGVLEGETARAARLLERLHSQCTPQWLLLDGAEAAAWRALLELGGREKGLKLLRVEATRLAGLDLIEVEECARRLARLARLRGALPVLDLARTDGAEMDDDALRLLLKTLDDLGCRAIVLSRAETHLARLLGTLPYELMREEALPMSVRTAVMRAAARRADVYLTDDEAETLAQRYPLQVDNLEHAIRLARRRPKNYAADDPSLERLTAAFKELASEGISQLVDRLEPVFSLDEVVLPLDRQQQLAEIVDHIRLATRVLDGWKFRAQLPYGRGVAALFFGVSGTGKTMAALGIARQLGIQLLRLDLSRVVSKYIGDTEKNLDRVFTDAQRSGAALLIDEADALLGKRSEVKDAHDRYANIEVAYLLQRLEAFEGLAILTTNLRKNLDPAFLRRLRFIVEFPKPDAEARARIWQQCLPHESHALDDAEFRLLARRLDLTGGQIRQITLRAAFIAAAADTQIRLEHISYAAEAELAKHGLPPIVLMGPQQRRAA